MYAQANGQFQGCPHTWTNKCYVLGIRTKYDIKLISYALLYMVVIQCLLDINIKYNYPTTDGSVWIDGIKTKMVWKFAGEKPRPEHNNVNWER